MGILHNVTGSIRLQCSSMNQDVLTLSHPHAAHTHPPSYVRYSTALFEDMVGRWRWSCVYGPQICVRDAAGGRAPAASLIAVFRRGGSRKWSRSLLEKVLLP